MKHNVDRLKRSVYRPIVLCSFLILALAALSGIGSRASLISSHLSWSKPFSSIFKMSYHKELQVAELAVQRATILTKKVFHEKVKGTVSKNDRSPVTIGDFGAQALIISAIRQNFPDDEIMGEEEANSLRENRNLSSQIWDLVREVKLDDEDADSLLGGPVKSEEDMLQAIDAGNSAGGPKGRIWALDPIDGTTGFLRGGQYAVCLALVVDGDVKVGVLGCPNLSVDDTERLTVGAGENQSDEEGKGVLFGAIIGQGASSRPLSLGILQPKKEIHMNPLTDITQATFCESVEAAHSSHEDQAAIAAKLGITKSSVRMDSQAKYASIARGAGDLYLRLPVSKTYQECIWDHAAGDLIVREAGGTVTDALGKRLDFSKGRKLVANKGVVATPKDIHGPVLEAVMSVLGSKKE